MHYLTFTQYEDYNMNKIIAPKTYKPNIKTSDKKYIKNGFTRRNNGYVLTKYLYKNIIKI